MSNIESFKEILSTTRPNVTPRPHVKTHKCVEISLLCQAPLCFQVLDELEPHVLRADEFKNTDWLLTSTVIPGKMPRLAHLASKVPTISVLTDSLANVNALSVLDVPLGVFVEVDVGQRRTGMDAGELHTIVDVVKAIQGSKNLEYKGIHVYQGSLQHTRSELERRGQVEEAMGVATKVRDHLSSVGLTPPAITGGGTGSFQVDLDLGVLTEVQPGSFLLMDVDYGLNFAPPPFRRALFIKSSVLCDEETGPSVVIDAGSKAVDLVSGPPILVVGAGGEELEGAVYSSGGDEHGVLSRDSGGLGAYKTGGEAWLVPCHVDPNVNLFEELFVLEGEEVVDVWQVHRSCGR